MYGELWLGERLYLRGIYIYKRNMNKWVLVFCYFENYVNFFFFYGKEGVKGGRKDGIIFFFYFYMRGKVFFLYG